MDEVLNRCRTVLDKVPTGAAGLNLGNLHGEEAVQAVHKVVVGRFMRAKRMGVKPDGRKVAAVAGAKRPVTAVDKRQDASATDGTKPRASARAKAASALAAPPTALPAGATKEAAPAGLAPPAGLEVDEEDREDVAPAPGAARAECHAHIR